MVTRLRPELDYRVPRGIAATLALIVVLLLSLYGAQQVLGYWRVAGEAEGFCGSI